MRKLLLVVPILFVASMGYCDAIWRSSFTATADTARSLCGQTSGRKCRFHGVRVGHGTSGIITLYNSQGSATNPFAVLYTSNAVINGHGDYDVLLTSGCSYTTSAANHGTTFLYDCQ